jgi:hypothetical protein
MIDWSLSFQEQCIFPDESRYKNVKTAKMKHILLFLLFIPLPFFAQNFGDPSASSDVIKTSKIEAQTITTFFGAYSSGLSSKRDSSRLDTAIIEKRQFDENGNTLHLNYTTRIDKAHYNLQTDFEYKSEHQLSYAITHENGSFLDSSIVTGTFPDYTSIDYYNDHKIIYEHKGDSLLIEKRITGNDTIVHKRTLTEYANRTHWDDEYSGSYAKKIIHTGSGYRQDTCTFYNEKGKIILIIVDHYDMQNRVIRSDYYNYTDKNFRIYSAPYSEKLSMSIYMPTDRKGNLTYSIRRTYNDLGLITEVKHIPVKKRIPITDLKYAYSYF